MGINLISCQFAALMHDIGKFYQRTYGKSDLTDDELRVCPQNNGHYSHYHAGYTARFFKEVLKMDNQISYLSSVHHLEEKDAVAEIIKVADRLASSLDRSDEVVETETNRQTFVTARLSTIFHEVSFDDNKTDNKIGKYLLSDVETMDYPDDSLEEKNIEEACQEYKELYTKFVDEVKKYSWNIDGNITFEQLNRMYALLYKYTTTIPASSYESSITYVSLFDHLKLTSAIAGCLFLNNGIKEFYMYEFDISGIQNFIYKIIEGSEQKKKVAKALRGRSAFISILTDSISYKILNEFKLHVSNIMFNSGGGATILLPACDDTIEKISLIEKEIKKNLYNYFGTDISFSSAFVKMNENELKTFKTEKALELKTNLDIARTRRYNSLINDDSSFFYKSSYGKDVCRMCGSMKDVDEECCNCLMFEYISDFYTKNRQFLIEYDFKSEYSNESNKINLGYCYVHLRDNVNVVSDNYFCSVNCYEIGEIKHIANSVPILNNQILNFENISQKLIPDSYGDKKLGILKMDVDNLSAIFSFGLRNKESDTQQRSLSKYLTMSRLIQMFFGKILVDICKNLSENINDDISEETENATMFYINYAGGDDLVIVGPAYGIIILADSIEYEFNNYTLNKENISFSAGIHIQDDKEPIRFGILEADKMLKLSKQQEGKNSISLINATLKYDHYCELLNEVEDMKNMIDSNCVTRTFIYNLFLMLKDRNYDEFKYIIPIVYYYLYKNINDNKLREKILKCINDIDSDESLNRYLLKLKLSIMFTRE